MIGTVPGRDAAAEAQRFSISRFLAGHEYFIPLFFFAAFLAFTLPGIQWGAPAIWHPDEVALRSIKALHGDWAYYEANFNHPFLPQNAMYLLGRLVMTLGGDDGAVLVAARVMSAVLVALTLVLAYYTARRAGARPYVSALAPALLLASSEMAKNGRFAHTDAYVVFFSALTIFFLVQYQASEGRGWLYASFLAAGLALSSKYNSLLLVMAPALVWALKRRADLRRQPLAFIEPLFIGAALWVLGFSIGTPKFLGWGSWFLKRAVPAFIYNGNYGNQPGAVRGWLGQYLHLAEGVGLALALLFGAALLWSVYRLARERRMDARAVLLLCVLLLDLPLMFSYNLAMRFFLPMLPLLAVLGALALGDLFGWAQGRGRPALPRLLATGLALVLVFSLARSLSLALLFIHDARYPAGRFLETLPDGSSLEETFYPSTIPAGKFEREHNYPLYFLKTAADVPPTDGRLDLNTGEAGLLERGTDYLLIDSFTAAKFEDPFTCSTMPVECDFFRQLAAGGSEHYRLLADFRYSPPAFLPRLRVDFVNPAITIYERVK